MLICFLFPIAYQMPTFNFLFYGRNKKYTRNIQIIQCLFHILNVFEYMCVCVSLRSTFFLISIFPYVGGKSVYIYYHFSHLHQIIFFPLLSFHAYTFLTILTSFRGQFSTFI